MAHRLSHQEINDLFQHEFTAEHADKLASMIYSQTELDSNIIHTAQSFVEAESYMKRN